MEWVALPFDGRGNWSPHGEQGYMDYRGVDPLELSYEELLSFLTPDELQELREDEEMRFVQMTLEGTLRLSEEPMGGTCQCCGKEICTNKISISKGDTWQRVYTNEYGSTIVEFYCQECRLTKFAKCGHCDTIVPIDKIHVNEYGKWCDKCWSHNFEQCDHCGKDTMKGEVKKTGENGDMSKYCRTCYKELYKVCSMCNTMTRVYSMRKVSLDKHPEHDKYYCLDKGCADKIYQKCACGCGRDVFIPKAHNIDGHYVCNICFRERSKDRALHEYGYKPEPIFYYEGTAHPTLEKRVLEMGVELEVNGAGKDIGHAAAALAIAGDHHVYIKTDGSVSEGFEIVTYPMDLEYHSKYMPWKAVMTELKKRGYRSHDRSCGLHIHVNRTYLGETEYEQQQTILKILLIYEKFWPYMVKFARRENGQLDRYARRYGKPPVWRPSWSNEKVYDYPPECEKNPEYLDFRLKDARDCAGRYYAINNVPEETLEFRIFRGTLIWETFIAALQFTEQTIHVALNTSMDDVGIMTWKNFVNRIKGKHTELDAYLIDKKMMTPTKKPISMSESEMAKVGVTDPEEGMA